MYAIAGDGPAHMGRAQILLHFLLFDEFGSIVL